MLRRIFALALTVCEKFIFFNFELEILGQGYVVETLDYSFYHSIAKISQQKSHTDLEKIGRGHGVHLSQKRTSLWQISKSIKVV